MLAAIGQLAGDAYGVTIRERAGELLGGRTPSVGAIHYTLTRLEREGLVRTRMSEPEPVRGGRAKRLFELTAVGERSLREAQAELRSRASALTRDWRPA